MAAQEHIPSFREPIVYITGHHPNGKARILNAASPSPQKFPAVGANLIPVFSTGNGYPVDLNNDMDVTAHHSLVASGGLKITNPNGSVCRFVDIAPGIVPNMHRTQSIDYGVVIEGEVIMELDDGSETLLKRGDVVVQRGTMHGWKNPSETEWARMMFVLLEAKSVFIGGKELKEGAPKGLEGVIRLTKGDH
jgi:quercetin dioxygenase-like cupin family protein